MNKKERVLIAGVLGMIALLVGIDLFNDSREGVVGWHVLLEGLTGGAALFGVFYILRDSFVLKHHLEEADLWRAQSKKYIDGLSLAIDQQLSKWKLSEAEKEVAFLLLKGLSLKEIADVRNTTEKTARVQSMAIYSKSGLSGRSELSAFFLEDLLAPPSPKIK